MVFLREWKTSWINVRYLVFLKTRNLTFKLLLRMRNSIVLEWVGNFGAHSGLLCRRVVLCDKTGVYKVFIKSLFLFLWPTQMWKELCVHIPNTPATLPYFYGYAHNNSIPAVSCHNILCLTVPFTLSTPCFPCPMLFDLHISWSRKWTLLSQNTEVQSSPACTVLLSHISRTTGGLRASCVSAASPWHPLWDQTPAI